MKSIWKASRDPLWRSQFDSRVTEKDGFIYGNKEVSMSNHHSARKSSRYYKKNTQPVPKPLTDKLSFQIEDKPLFPDRWIETYSEKKPEFKPKIRRVTKDGTIIEKK